jgi:predicted nucleic acid-binding protein
LNYVDTSVLVAALVQEAHTRRAERWLTAGEALAISDWTITEVSSALAQKLRIGNIDVQTRAAATDAIDTMIASSLVLLPVERAHFRTAAKFADQHRLGLRAPDALHLAVAADNNATLVTLDKKLATAGRKLGVATRLL